MSYYIVVYPSWVLVLQIIALILNIVLSIITIFKEFRGLITL